ncbi:TonB-dependent receptor family protein [Comamonas serinivorans]|nr:TonB-dependent receptor [Comamonas serinivorans]
MSLDPPAAPSPDWSAPLGRVGLGAGLWLVACAACAAESAAEAPAPVEAIADLPAITVQAGQLPQRELRVPAALQRVDAATLARVPGGDVADALADVPGVVALNRNNHAQDLQLSMRGFGARAAFGVRGIRLLADGIPLTTPDGQGQVTSLALSSAERLEVLTGPLAQLHGNAAGGVIQTFTREAAATPELRAGIGLGRDGLRRTDWQLARRFGATQSVGLVADLATFETEGWRAHSAARRRQFNTVLTWDVHDQTRLRLIANALDAPLAQDPAGLTAAQWAADPRQAGSQTVARNARKRVSQETLGAVLTQGLGDGLTLEARAYGGQRRNLQHQAASSWVGLQRGFGGLGLQLTGEQSHAAGWPVDWTVGLAWDRSSERRQAGATLAGDASGPLTRHERNVAANTDAFVQAHWQLAERWQLLTGARHSTVRLASRDHWPADGDGSGRIRFRATNPVLGLAWLARADLNLYLSWGRGLETPTLAEVAYRLDGTQVSPAFNTDLGAARSRQWELGAKWHPDRDTRVNLALFHIATRDELVAARSAGGRTAYVNAGQTQRQGLELAARHRLSPHWDAALALTLMRARYGSADTGPSGTALPGIPRRQASLQLRWRQHPQTRSSAALRGTELQLDWLGRAALWADDANRARVAGYGLVHARLQHGFSVGRTELVAHAAIDNLLNKRYVGSVIVNQAAGQYLEPGLPRGWQLGLQARVPF